MTQTDYRIRPIGTDPEEMNLVLSSWKKSARKIDPYKHLSNEAWHRIYAPRIERVARNEQILMVVPNDEPSILCGWICFRRPSRLYYIYVKRIYRREYGIARELYQEAGRPYLCAWWNNIAIGATAKYGLRYNPNLMKER